MSGWQLSGNAPSSYIRYAKNVMEPWTEDLIRQAKCKDGDRVLDVACGTGFVATRVDEVSGTNCKITGLDVNEPMLNAARQNTGIEWHLGSATEMPFGDGSFDVVLCQQGLQYFPDRQATMKEIARVLVPGGRVSLNVWGAMERQVYFVALIDAVSTFLGPEASRSYDMAYSLNTRDQLQDLANGTGLKNARFASNNAPFGATTWPSSALGSSSPRGWQRSFRRYRTTISKSSVLTSQAG